MTLQNTINLCSLNVNGANSREKRNRIFEWINAQKSSITFLQETHFDDKIENDLNNSSGFEFICSHGTSASRGVAIVTKKTLNYEVISKHSDTDGRFILINIEIDNTIFTLVCIYAPNCRTARNSFFKKVSEKLKEYGIGIPIVGGDFNETLKQIDRKGSFSNIHSQSVNSFKTLIKSNKLSDNWRNMNENVQQFTWRRKDKSQASRIDFILIGEDFKSLVESCKIKPAIIKSTDHQCVFLKFRTGLAEKGNGYWKINNSILEDKDYQKVIINLIDKYLIEKNGIDCRLLWDGLKIEVREVTMLYCKNRAKRTREYRRRLEKDLEQKMKLKDESQENSENLDTGINFLETELSKIYDEKAKGAQIRSREKWVELGERNNSYFYGLEKKRQVKKSINKLKGENGELISDQAELLGKIKNYYEKLYN